MQSQFIIPVTIAQSSENIILDGQQRLTSILLTYLGYMPIKDKFITTEDDLAKGVYKVSEPHLEASEDIEVFLKIKEVLELMEKEAIKQGCMLAMLWKYMAINSVKL